MGHGGPVLFRHSVSPKDRIFSLVSQGLSAEISGKTTEGMLGKEEILKDEQKLR